MLEGTIQTPSHGFLDLVCSPLQHCFLRVSPGTLYYLGKRSYFEFPERVFVTPGPLKPLPIAIPSASDLLPCCPMVALLQALETLIIGFIML